MSQRLLDSLTRLRPKLRATKPGGPLIEALSGMSNDEATLKLAGLFLKEHIDEIIEAIKRAN